MATVNAGRTTAARSSTFGYRCRHVQVTAPVILVDVRCPAGCRLGRRWLCYDHERAHDESEQAVYCVDGEWIEDGPPEPPVSEFRARWNETMLRARGQHPEQVEATIRTLGVCDRRTEADVSAWPEAALPWATAWQRLTGRGCRARWPVPGTGYGRARCELAQGHECDHALERGMDTPRWSR